MSGNSVEKQNEIIIIVNGKKAYLQIAITFIVVMNGHVIITRALFVYR